MLRRMKRRGGRRHSRRCLVHALKGDTVSHLASCVLVAVMLICSAVVMRFHAKPDDQAMGPVADPHGYQIALGPHLEPNGWRLDLT